MRAAFQILAIPYRIIDGTPRYCVFHRADHDQWQFIAGGGEDEETPLEAAKRETFEEGGVQASKWFELTSLAYLPITVISEKCRQHWSKDTYVIPEYTFGFECEEDMSGCRIIPNLLGNMWAQPQEISTVSPRKRNMLILQAVSPVISILWMDSILPSCFV